MRQSIPLKVIVVERCDFSAVAQILLNNLDEIHAVGQMDFMYLLFQSFIESDEALDFDFTESSVCRTLKGYINLSPELRRYYDKAHLDALSADIARNLFPKMYDSAKAAEELHQLALLSPNLSELKKQELNALYAQNAEPKRAAFSAAILYAAMHCKFVRTEGNLSPFRITSWAIPSQSRSRSFAGGIPNWKSFINCFQITGSYL